MRSLQNTSSLFNDASNPNCNLTSNHRVQQMIAYIPGPTTVTLTSHNLNIPDDGVDVDVNGVRKVHASTCGVRFTTPLAETERRMRVYHSPLTRLN